MAIVFSYHLSHSKAHKTLQPPDSLYLTAAEGWLGLGDINAASAELDNITPELREHPAVLEVRWQIYAKAKRWDACIEIAKTLTDLVPNDINNWVHLAYSTRQAKTGGLEAAVGMFVASSRRASRTDSGSSEGSMPCASGGI